MRINNTSLFSTVKLSDSQQVPKFIQVLRTGSFNHPVYGNFEITTQTLAEMVQNFNDKVRGIDMAFDYFHESEKLAAGWVNAMELRENGTELWADVSWTPKAQRMLAERELRYFSPDFAFKWTDPESGATYNNVLFGGGLTNRPFVKEMEAIVATENKGETMTELEKAQAKLKELETANKKLSEDNAKLAAAAAAPPPAPQEESDEVKALQQQIAALNEQLQKAKADQEAALAEKAAAQKSAADAQAAQQMAEKERAFGVLLSEGKACAAQKEAYLKGDMAKFIELAEPVHLKPAGTSDTMNLGETDTAAIIKLAEEIEEKAKAAGRPVNRGESISLAKKQLKK